MIGWRLVRLAIHRFWLRRSVLIVSAAATGGGGIGSVGIRSSSARSLAGADWDRLYTYVTPFYFCNCQK